MTAHLQTNGISPCKDESLPDIIVLLAHDPVVCAHAGDVLAAIAFDPQDQIIKGLQIYHLVRLIWLLQHGLCSAL